MAELYRITSPSGKQYIGIAKNGLNSRWSIHISESKSGSNTALHNAIRKYGAEAFQKEVLVVADYEYIRDLECKAIELFNTFHPFGYNLTKGGDGTVGYLLSQEAKDAIKAATKKRMQDPSAREHLRQLNIGKKLTEETKAKTLGALKRYVQQHGGPMLGKKHSEDTKARISASLTGKKRGPASEEMKKRLRSYGLGKRWYNNGINIVFCLEGQQPNGYVLGRRSTKFVKEKHLV